MPSEYDALLEAPDTRKSSEYDALLASPTPETPKQRMSLGEMLFDPQTAQNLRGGIQDIVSSIPGMVSQLPKIAYQGVKFFSGGPQGREQVIPEALTEAVAQGQQMAKDIQAPLGSRESFRGLGNLAIMAAPALGEALGEAALLGKKPPIQGEALPKIPEIPISDTVIQQPKPIGGEINAEQVISPTQVHGDVQYTPGPQESLGEVPANVGSEGVQARGQGTQVQVQAGQVTPERPTALQDRRAYIKQRTSEGATLEQASQELTEMQDANTAKMQESLPPGSRVKTDTGVFEREADGVWRAVEGQGSGVIHGEPVGEIVRVGHPEASKPLPTGVQQTPQEVAQTVPQPEPFPSLLQSAEDQRRVEQPTPVSKSEGATTASPLTQTEVPTVSETIPKGQAEPQSITSIKNEQVDTERSTRGLPSVVEPARKAFGETWEQATKKIDSDPGYPDRLIEELKSKPRALNDVEDAALLHRQVDLQNQFQKSTDALFKARESGDGVAAMEHDARVNALSDQLLELYDVGKKAGTETGRGLAARKLLAAEDFSLANMVTQKRAANPTIDVETATKSAQEASDNISAAQSALDAHESSPKAEAYKKRLKTLTEQYRTKTAQGDFAKRVPVKIPLDKEGQALKADLERAKKDWLTALQKDRAANRTPSQKFWDRFVGVERAMKLSSDVVLAKLSAAALVREAGLTPAEEVVGAGIGKILPGLAKRAPREGGFSADAEIKSKSEMFTSGMKDAWQNLKMKQTDLDTLYSSRKPPPPSEFYDYLGYLHGALKAPIKRAEFARSLTKRMKWAVENGQDLNNVNTMRELSEGAYVDANRSIFMQDNVVASTFTGALRMAEMSKKAPNLGPAVARIGRFLVPIVKIPTNIVGEVSTGVHGVATGGSRAAVAYLKGIDSLPTTQADSIMRQLKKGAIGNALLLTGYYTANNIGGFYHDQDKRTKEDVHPGRYRIGSVDIPASAGHSTGAMLLNIGATVKRVQDERIKKSESMTKGLGEGIRAAGSGLAHEIPFVPAATGITDALGTKGGFEKYINGMIQSTIVPSLSSHIAKILDTPGSLPSNILQEPVKRKPTGPVEAVKMGIPGLRQTVPEKKTKTKSSGTSTYGY